MTAPPPRQVLLFTGHMVDQPQRPHPRFPQAKVANAAERLRTLLAQLGAGPADLAYSQAAAGGDVLFLEACQVCGVRCQVLLPFAELEFVQRSILPSCQGQAWLQRWQQVRARLDAPPSIMGDAPIDHINADAALSPYERCNLWLLAQAQRWGVDRLHLICLWDGAGGDGPGGTRHLVHATMALGVPVHRIAPQDL